MLITPQQKIRNLFAHVTSILPYKKLPDFYKKINFSIVELSTKLCKTYSLCFQYLFKVTNIVGF